jgi:hypothetical protein
MPECAASRLSPAPENVQAEVNREAVDDDFLEPRPRKALRRLLQGIPGWLYSTFLHGVCMVGGLSGAGVA